MADMFAGLRVVTSPFMVKTVVDRVQRSLVERWLTWPWRPWVRTKLVQISVPSDEVLRIGNRLIVHPAMLERLRRGLIAERPTAPAGGEGGGE